MEDDEWNSKGMQKERIRWVFEELKDRPGGISLKTFSTFWANLHGTTLDTLGILDTEDLFRAIAICDQDQNQVIDVDEFIDWLYSNVETEEAEDAADQIEEQRENANYVWTQKGIDALAGNSMCLEAEFGNPAAGDAMTEAQKAIVPSLKICINEGLVQCGLPQTGGTSDDSEVEDRITAHFQGEVIDSSDFFETEG